MTRKQVNSCIVKVWAGLALKSFWVSLQIKKKKNVVSRSILPALSKQYCVHAFNNQQLHIHFAKKKKRFYEPQKLHLDLFDYVNAKKNTNI